RLASASSWALMEASSGVAVGSGAGGAARLKDFGSGPLQAAINALAPWARGTFMCGHLNRGIEASVTNRVPLQRTLQAAPRASEQVQADAGAAHRGGDRRRLACRRPPFLG